MRISLRLSGLIIILAGIIFLISALIGKSVFAFIVGVVCIVCGILWILPRRIKSSLRTAAKPKSRSSRGGSGRYSR